MSSVELSSFPHFSRLTRGFACQNSRVFYLNEGSFLKWHIIFYSFYSTHKNNVCLYALLLAHVSIWYVHKTVYIKQYRPWCLLTCLSVSACISHLLLNPSEEICFARFNTPFTALTSYLLLLLGAKFITTLQYSSDWILSYKSRFEC